MFAVLAYDIPTDALGLRRRNKIYKICKKHGYHVQNSVFELSLDYSSLLRLEHDISNVLDNNVDSVRIYYIGKRRTDDNVKLLGKREVMESNDDCFVV